MEEKQLRQYDFVTSIALILFSLWTLAEAFKMPMKDSYGGVESVWYVSPALFPLFIGGGTLILGAILLIHSIRSGGAKNAIAAIKNKASYKIDDKSIRVLTVVLALATFIYLFIPFIDFFLSIAIFLSFLCAAFYADNDTFRKSYTIHFIIGSSLFLILRVTGLADIINGILKYNMDILALLFLIYLNIAAPLLGKKIGVPKKIFRHVTLVAILVPLVLCPIFRYCLLVPLPVEGGIIKLMNLIYYALR